MKRFREEKAKAWREHELRFTCVHAETLLRRRVVKGGGVQYVMQCQACGDAMPGPLPRAVALEMAGGKEPLPFDDGAKGRWDDERGRAGALIEARFGTRFWANYERYLQSPEWTEKRRLVFERAGGVCEGCRAASAEEVHHRTYDHVGDEFLFELVAVCKACHERLHRDA